MFGKHAAAFELPDFANPLAVKCVVVGRQHQHALVTTFEIRFDPSLLEMGQDRIGQTEGNKSLAHAHFVGENLDLGALRGFRVEETIEQDVDSALLPGGVFGVTDTRAVSSQVEVFGAGDHPPSLAPPDSTAFW